MQPLRLLLLPLLLALPLASAGYDASVDYLETDQTGCRASTAYDGDRHDNGTWGWSWWHAHDAESCSDSFAYLDASVRDDDGEVARVRAGTHESSSDNGTSGGRTFYDRWNGTSSFRWSNGDERHNATAEGRDVDVTTREGSLAARDGCQTRTRSTWSYESASYQANGSEGRTTWSESAYSDASRCATSATLSRDGESVTVTPWSEACDYSYASSSEQSRYQWGNESYQGNHHQWESANGCASGASAGAGDASFWAGLESRCEYATYGNEANHSGSRSSYSGREQSCSNAFVVRGPDGLTLWVGGASEERTHCADRDGGSYCSESGDSRTGARLAWVHSPLGPAPQEFFLP